MIDVLISTERLTAQVGEGQNGAAGAEVIFNGYVREQGEYQSLQALWLEHYPQMTEQALTTIAERAYRRFDCQRICLYHRVGRIAVGELIVSVLVTAAHRRAAFDATEFIVDYLKNQAPFWKQELSADGASHWVEQKQSDRDALARWRDSV